MDSSDNNQEQTKEPGLQPQRQKVSSRSFPENHLGEPEQTQAK